MFSRKTAASNLLVLQTAVLLYAATHSAPDGATVIAGAGEYGLPFGRRWAVGTYAGDPWRGG